MKEYDINGERIRRAVALLDALPKLSARIEQINALLFKGGITASEFRRLVNERSGLVKQYDDMRKEIREKFNLMLEEDRGKTEITFNSDFNPY